MLQLLSLVNVIHVAVRVVSLWVLDFFGVCVVLCVVH